MKKFVHSKFKIGGWPIDQSIICFENDYRKSNILSDCHNLDEIDYFLIEKKRKKNTEKGIFPYGVDRIKVLIV